MDVDCQFDRKTLMGHWYLLCRMPQWNPNVSFMRNKFAYHKSFAAFLRAPNWLLVYEHILWLPDKYFRDKKYLTMVRKRTNDEDLRQNQNMCARMKETMKRHQFRGPSRRGKKGGIPPKTSVQAHWALVQREKQKQKIFCGGVICAIWRNFRNLQSFIYSRCVSWQKINALWHSICMSSPDPDCGIHT